MKIKRDKYDIIWSKMVRERDGKCLNCGKRPPYKLEAHHIMPRGRSITRYLVANGITLCTHCHTFGDKSVHRIGKDFVVNIIGSLMYKKLEQLSHKSMTREKARQQFIKQYNL